MKFYMAPLEGITGYVFRNAQYAIFHPADKYFTPFITPGLNSTKKSKALRDVLPENNPVPNLVPQILTNRVDEFLYTEAQLRDMGYNEINLNLGCPSGTVVAKRRGSGFLAYPEDLNAFLDGIYSQAKAEISIKTRLGKDSPEEFDALLDIYNRYPVKELIIHPRTREDFYRNQPNLEMFRLGLEKSRCPVCYNGNIFTKSDYYTFCERFPEVETVMVGRGAVANPALFGVLSGTDSGMDKRRLRVFHDRVYVDYEKMMYGETPLLYKMKELWNYLIWLFEDADKFRKKIRKTQRLKDYDRIAETIFETLEIAGSPGFQPEK